MMGRAGRALPCPVIVSWVGTRRVACGTFPHPPGSRAGLLPPSPRRTARASFPASRASLANAPGRTRLCSVQRLAMDVPVTGGMQEPPVVCRLAAPVGPPDSVMVVPSRESGARWVADGAEPLVRFPQVPQLPSAFEVVGPLHASAFLDVHCPWRVIRVGRPFDLHVPLARPVSCTTARACRRLPVVAHARPSEGPPASVSRRKVLLRAPSAGGRRRSPWGPGPPRLQDRGVHLDAGHLAEHLARRGGPPT
jgi:hypothetical protein